MTPTTRAVLSHARLGRTTLLHTAERLQARGLLVITGYEGKHKRGRVAVFTLTERGKELKREDKT